MATNPDPAQRAFEFELEKHAHERWWREDELVNQRTTWLLTTQAVLGTAYGFLLYRIAEVRYGKGEAAKLDTDRYIEVLWLLSNLVASIGIVSSAMSPMGICAACLAQYGLRKQCGPYLGVTPGTTGVGHFVAISTPLLCLFAWFGSFLLSTLVAQWVPQR